MNTVKLYFGKVLSFLRIHSIAGGLEISDQVLRLVYFDGKVWQMAAIVLGPGVLEKGKIKNAEAFVAALHALKLKIPGVKDNAKKINVIISLSSVSIYSQTFTLPIVEGEELEKAVDLNVQILSPTDITQSYFGWQMLGRDEPNMRLVLAAAFIDKGLVDEMTTTLYSAGFVTVGVESRALALTRILREKGVGIDLEKSYLLLNIDNSGLEFLVVKKGQLYFEYATGWEDIADDKGQIAVDKFKEALLANFRQVTNFYDQHWPDPLGAVIICSASFSEIAQEAIGTISSLPTVKFTLTMGQPISPEWLIALGCSLRGFNWNHGDKEINLAGEGARDLFQKEQFINFISLWRVLIPAVLAVLVVALVLANNFLALTENNVAAQSTFNSQPQEAREIVSLQASSTVFNQSVALLESAQKQQNSYYALLGTITMLAATSTVHINHIDFKGTAVPILVSGFADTEDEIVAFKNNLAANPMFGEVTLPLSAIQSNVNNGYSFSLSFTIVAAGAAPLSH